MGLERLDRVLVVGGHKDHEWRFFFSGQFKGDLDAALSRHVDIEKGGLRVQVFQFGSGLGAIRRGPDHFDLRVLLEEFQKPVPGQFFIVRNKYPDHGFSSLSPNGISNLTRVPFPGADS
ncbi:MAG: hypothetical protein BWY49_00152 [Candidatus Omnitrophica bacterium ADurb.Bin314]|nr:MAG: hypothetical protein BWY49_00152 [Candidatus Omnitrophica bacterium ADurb.Bin314]